MSSQTVFAVGAQPPAVSAPPERTLGTVVEHFAFSLTVLGLTTAAAIGHMAHQRRVRRASST